MSTDLVKAAMIVDRRRHRAEIIVNHGAASRLVHELVEQSTWFEVFPLPDDNYRIVTRDEHERFLKSWDLPENRPNDEEPVCPGCGGSQDNIQGCLMCCRDCGWPCSEEKDAEAFHRERATRR